ncbi:MAG: thiolase family protein, partial [Alphaproteobacteria bacterium]
MNAFQKVSIPYGGYWSTPFAKWQGSLANLHVMRFAAHVAKAELAKRNIPAAAFDYAVLGTTTPQRNSFYGLPWLMSMIGNADVGGTVVAQACATGARTLATAAGDLEQGFATTSLCVTGDRTSNAPVVMYPDPTAQGGAPVVERWMLDNFNSDPLGGPAMVGTAENCARDWQIGTEEQHDVVVRRWQQYEAALANDRAFQKKFMTLPFEVPDTQFKKTVGALAGDEGVRASTNEGLAKLKPVTPGGTVTYGGQTHPADGGAAII